MTTTTAYTAQQTLDYCSEWLLDRKGEDIVALDLRKVAEFTDYFMICTGTSDVQVRALADAVIEGMKEAGQRPLHVEGYDSRKWVLIDFVDVVVHVFQPEEREFYALERLWGDAPARHVTDEQLPHPA
jgi:ribosome-associated protein